MMPSLKTPYATIVPFAQPGGSTHYSLSVGWDRDWEEISNTACAGAATPEEAMTLADAALAADWPRTGDWEPVEVTAFYGLPRVTGWRAPVDPVKERRVAETFRPENFQIWND